MLGTAEETLQPPVHPQVPLWQIHLASLLSSEMRTAKLGSKDWPPLHLGQMRLLY